MSWLSLAIWTPIVFGLVILPLGRDSQASLARWLALAGSVLGFLVTLPLYTGFRAGTAQMQFVEKAPWIERFNIYYHFGVDGILLWFVLLTAFITIIVVIAGWEVIQKKVNQDEFFRQVRLLASPVELEPEPGSELPQTPASAEAAPEPATQTVAQAA